MQTGSVAKYFYVVSTTHPPALQSKRSNAVHLPALLSEQGPSSVDRYQLAGKRSLRLHALCMVCIVKGVVHE